MELYIKLSIAFIFKKEYHDLLKIKFNYATSA